MMKTINEQRPKAFIGAIIGLAGSAVSGILSARARKKEEARQRAINNAKVKHETNINQADATNETFANFEQNREVMQENFENKFMRNGGKKSKSSELFPCKGVAPNIAEGGTAIPIKKNTYLLKGRKHETGGIVIGKGKNSIEAEGDEVVQITPKNLKVFSAQPILNGNSPAELVQRGVKPDKVFNAQERFKDINGLNDDGTKKKKFMGGQDEVKQDNVYVSRPIIPEAIERTINPSDRVKARPGTKYSELSADDKFRLKRSDRLKEDYKGLEIESPEFDAALAILSGGASAAYKAGSKAGSKAGAAIVKSFAKETGKELASNAVSTVASEIHPLLGLVPVPTKKSLPVTTATKSTPKTERIAGLLESPEKMTRDELKKINAVAKRFGYNPIPLDYAKDRTKAERAVKDLVEQHNTFLRGVRQPTAKERADISKELAKRGLEDTEDNMWKYTVTHLAPPTGAGRADVPPGTPATLYASNSANQSVGYANKSKFEFDNVDGEGIIAKVRRPVKYNSSRMTDWWVDNDFNFNNKMSYYRRKLIDDNVAKYGKLPDNIRNEINAIEKATFDTEVKNLNESMFNKQLSDDIKRKIERMDKRNSSNPSRATKYERYNLDNASFVEKQAYIRYLNNVIKNGEKKSYADFLKEEKIAFNKEYHGRARKHAIKTVAEKQGYKFDPNKANIYHTNAYGLHSSTRNTGNPRQHFIFTGDTPGEKVLDFVDYYEPTSEEILKGSRLHGKAIYKKGFSRRSRRLGGNIKSNKIMKLNENKLDVKTKSLMKDMKNNKVRLGSNRKRFPTLTGLYHGANEGRAIRSLREARSNLRYQYTGSTNNTPNISTASMYEKLPLAATSRTAIEQTNKKFNKTSSTGEAVKNQSFNSAFAAARKQGLKQFEYNGRSYGTQLADNSNVNIPKTTVTSKTNVTPKTSVIPKTVTTSKINDIKTNIPDVIITAPKRTTVSKRAVTTVANRVTPKTNIIPETVVTASRIPKMIKDNTYVPGQYSDTRSPKSNTAPRQSTIYSLYKGIKSALGVPERRKKLGGLSRKEDYSSSKKPYPNVNSKDFAGGNRSYPIPTKADARDALRLAGLHGRSDVRSKVYKKYPELRKKASYGTNHIIPETVVKGKRLEKMSPIKPSFNIGNPSIDSLPVKTIIDRSVMNPAGITSGAKITNPSTGKITPISFTGNTSSSNTSSSNKNGGFFRKIGNTFKDNTGELISAGIGAVGNIISGVMNNSSINDIQAPQVSTPKSFRSARMKTSYNIEPQLAEIRENERNLRRVIGSNTSSSATNIARQQRVANNAAMERNKLRATKENIETQLYNQDALNRQEITNKNIAAINEANRYNEISSTQTANDKIQAKANNRTQMIEGLIGAVRDYQLGVNTRRRDDLAFAAEAAKNPEQLDLFMNLMKKNKGRINELGFKLGGRNKLLCGGRKRA